MDIKDKQITVVGLGKSGMAAARFLHTRGATVTISDSASADMLPQAQQLLDLGVRLELGRHEIKSFTGADLIVLSPGVPHSIEPVLAATRKGVPVVGEIELASWFVKEPILAVTGTNGKTTTTELLGHMLEASGKTVFIGGNIGRPFIEYASNGQQADLVVLEISSFQLDTIQTFHPQVGIILNITDDHLDRYPSIESYTESKGRLFENQTTNDVAIYKGDDVRIEPLVENISSRKLPFASGSADSLLHRKQQGAIIDHQAIHLWDGNGRQGQIQLTDIQLPGRHNHENIAAASLATLASGGNMPGIGQALKSFKGLPHRLEYVDTVNQVAFFNDSKATNADAVVKALASFQSPLILIAGGRDKGADFQILKAAIHPEVKKIILIGEAKDLIQKELAGIVSTQLTESMEEAVFQSYAAASPGDIILLSPGCASFDMYPNYKKRGDDFRAWVAEIRRQST
jgi:UDP-N-acetylmuramoylalanine--D-glutamate ligase